MTLELVLTTTDSAESAEKLVKEMISSKLAVCALISSETSIYHWQNSLEKSTEYLIKFKTLENKSEELVNQIKKQHNYETCFIATIKTDQCNSEYLDYAKDYLNSEIS